MDEITMLVSCVEYYSYLKNIPGHKVFTSFERTGLLDTLLESRAMFPEMDLGFYIGMIDGLTALESDSKEKAYAAYEERTAMLLEVLHKIAKKHHMDAREACQMYYGSSIAEKVAEDMTGYYKKEPVEIFEAVEKE
ncbi:hypothetical protein H9X85_00255 [Anaerotignum lactatifermentans]|uniref:Uncharacterized protein n=1 Tax=Anaerotignum lactatifermentans TaxID=160404 RepID=A0ABS2G5Q8_9FIRM|nr:hypothetical protein [Anaerotignum lactatifermentans]MBM6828058.1 hypothetical protein [Anaerotignum lactatifermentans]MBM6876779.1 hypothetical protein [Anaerotignum lactatifermentans]MBM6949641.1 hypothetical protein [Anaerotignum lactatifermentans]